LGFFLLVIFSFLLLLLFFARVELLAGDRIKTTMSDDPTIYYGTVVSVSDYDIAFANSPWRRLKIQWDEGW
jgi:hypothetical protein